MSEFDALKPEERSDYRARLMDVCPPFWPRRGGPNGGNQHQNIRQDDDDVEPGNGGGGNMDAIYTQRDRVPPVKV